MRPLTVLIHFNFNVLCKLSFSKFSQTQINVVSLFTFREEFNERAPLPASDKNGENDRLRKILLLSVAYSANLGGTGTLTGTNPNIVLTGFLEQ